MLENRRSFGNTYLFVPERQCFNLDPCTARNRVRLELPRPPLLVSVVPEL